jgi:tRNA(Ile)-lysidine synthase
MILQFKKHLDDNFPFLKTKRFFLAISGGIDSMVMMHLFQQLNYRFAILHCNFQLRGKESDADLVFIQDYADSFDIPWSFGHFKTKAYAKENKLSIQMAARELRYDWFNLQLNDKQFAYVLTAHQADDDLETFLINLSRGTGLEGLIGIPNTNQNILRPMLPFSRLEIEEYAKKNNIRWREDSSNETDKYLRNNIRHNITPLLKELNPSFSKSFQATLKHLQQAQSLVEDATILIYNLIVTDEDDVKKFNIVELKRLPNFEAYLYQWLSPFGFSAWDDIYSLIDAQSGKQILSNDYRILKDRNYLILSPKNKKLEPNSYLINANQKEVKKPIKLSFSEVSTLSSTLNNAIFVDAKKLKYPLELRLWDEGDSFQPFGMNGNTKKVSKFLKDQKITLFDKEKIWLLCSDNQVVWIVGLRADERFKTDETTTKILQIRLSI